MFVVSGALVRTGALTRLTELVGEHASERPALVLGGFAALTVAASAFMNNTPVVVMLIPVAVQLAKQIGVSVSKLLIPLSYAAILGGICTLIGTSTNLLVDGVARANGLEPFHAIRSYATWPVSRGIWADLPAIFGAPTLPDRDTMADILSDRSAMKYFTEVAVPDGLAPDRGSRL